MAIHDIERFQRLVLAIDPGARFLRVWDLAGGVSAQVTGVEMERGDGRLESVIVRRHGDVDFHRNPGIAADEYRVLRLAETLGLPSPRPYRYDDSGEIFERPYVVLEYIEGATEPVPADAVEQMAEMLSRIHRAGIAAHDLSFLPRAEEREAERFRQGAAAGRESGHECSIRRLLESVWPLPERNRPVLLHGDFWPGNVVWRHGRLAGVIDWEDAAVGDPLADLANARLEVLWALGPEAMVRFTERYTAVTPVDLASLPYWDLSAAYQHGSRLGAWGLEAEREQAMRRSLAAFVQAAIERVTGD